MRLGKVRSVQARLHIETLSQTKNKVMIIVIIIINIIYKYNYKYNIYQKNFLRQGLTI